MIKKRKRKNPIDGKLISLLAWSFSEAKFNEFQNTLNYYYQGEECKDCGEKYWRCMCEYCVECNYTRCMCDLKEKIRNAGNEDYKNELRKHIVKFSKEILNSEQINKLKQLIKLRDSVKHLKYFN